MPAWGTSALPGGDVLAAWASVLSAWGNLTGEAGGEAITAWASACSPEELLTKGLPTGGTVLNQVIFPCFLISLLNLLTCLSLILMNLISLTLSINS